MSRGKYSSHLQVRLSLTTFRWSFGGNRLQMKAETHVLGDISFLLNSMSDMGLHVPSPLRSLQKKQEMLQMLIADETTRLMVWLFPLDPTKRQLIGSGQPIKPSPEVSSNPQDRVVVANKLGRPSPRCYRRHGRRAQIWPLAYRLASHHPKLTTKYDGT